MAAMAAMAPEFQFEPSLGYSHSVARCSSTTSLQLPAGYLEEPAKRLEPLSSSMAVPQGVGDKWDESTHVSPLKIEMTKKDRSCKDLV